MDRLTSLATPSHFTGKIPNGSTVLKRRQVFNIDRIVSVSVPYWEWNIPGNSTASRSKEPALKVGNTESCSAPSLFTHGGDSLLLSDNNTGNLVYQKGCSNKLRKI